MNNPKKNFLYNLIYQVLILIIPLITSPYLSRVVGVDGIGIYSYTYSIVYYFMMFCLLGVNNYGNRTIAKNRDDVNKLSNCFWSIYAFQVLMGIIMLVLYYLYIILFDVEHKSVALIQSLFIISAVIDINWLFMGLEEFKKTIFRNSSCKIISLILIIVFVKNKQDLWLYVLIMSGMTVLGQLLLWGFVPKYIKKVKISKKDILHHIKFNILLFIPVIAISLYKIMDKIMLGIMTNVNEVGYYENAEKIINIPITLIAALGTVMLPRMSLIFEKKETDKINSYIEKSMIFIMFLAYPMMFGLIAIGNDFAPIFFGIEFKKTGTLISLLSVTIPCLAFANVIRTQYLIPNEKDTIYIKSVFLGAFVNMFFNVVFIPKLYSVGACIGTIFAEFFVMLYQTLAVRNDLKVFEYMKKSLLFFLKALIMFGGIYAIKFVNMNILLRLFLQIIIGVGIYVLLNLKFCCSIIDFKIIVRKFKKQEV